MWAGGSQQHAEYFEEDEKYGTKEAILYSPMQKGMTTLMVRNVPVMYTQDVLVSEWPNNGTYDFLYLPRSAAGKSNLSYAFINFTTEAHAEYFRFQWQKKRLAQFSAKKALNISFAEVQGLWANLAQLKKKRVRRIEIRQCQPIVVQNGQRVEFTDALAALDKKAGHQG